jgi:hypothetical protein
LGGLILSEVILEEQPLFFGEDEHDDEDGSQDHTVCEEVDTNDDGKEHFTASGSSFTENGQIDLDAIRDDYPDFPGWEVVRDWHEVLEV